MWKSVDDRIGNNQEREMKAMTHNRDGYALFVVMLVCAILTMAGTIGWQLAGSASKRNRLIGDRAKALAVAEAGVADMLDKLGQDRSGWVDTAVTNTIGGDSYTVSATTRPGAIVIESTGTAGIIQQTTVLEILGDGDNSYRTLLMGDFAIVCGGDATIDTGAVTVEGNVHANGNILHTRGNTRIDGNLTAVGLVNIPAQPGHTVLAGVALVDIPDFLPFDTWYNMATNGGVYYSSSQVFDNQNRIDQPANGVVYVDGDVEIANRNDLHGTLVATGSITVNNRFTHSSYSNSWPAMLAGVNIELFNHNNYEGVIFAGNNISTRNNKDINGILIALNNINVENHCTIIPPSVLCDWNPGGEQEDIPVVVGGWVR